MILSATVSQGESFEATGEIYGVRFLKAAPDATWMPGTSGSREAVLAAYRTTQPWRKVKFVAGSGDLVLEYATEADDDFGGPPAPSIQATTSVVVEGKDPGGNSVPISVDPSGKSQVIAEGQDDDGNKVPLMTAPSGEVGIAARNWNGGLPLTPLRQNTGDLQVCINRLGTSGGISDGLPVTILNQSGQKLPGPTIGENDGFNTYAMGVSPMRKKSGGSKGLFYSLRADDDLNLLTAPATDGANPKQLAVDADGNLKTSPQAAPLPATVVQGEIVVNPGAPHLDQLPVPVGSRRFAVEVDFGVGGYDPANPPTLTAYASLFTGSSYAAVSERITVTVDASNNNACAIIFGAGSEKVGASWAITGAWGDFIGIQIDNPIAASQAANARITFRGLP